MKKSTTYFLSLALLFSISFISKNSYATPSRIDVIFMGKIAPTTPPKISFLKNIINHAEAETEGSGELKKNVKESESENEKTGTLPPIDGVNSNLIHCDEKNYHSFFCPPKKESLKKRPKNPSPILVEIFIDISSSFEMVDPPTSGTCARKEFLISILKKCSKEMVSVELYNTEKSPMKNINDSCGVYGLNNKQKLIEWIKMKKVNHLILVTDVYELEKEFYDELKKLKAKFYGDMVMTPIDRTNLAQLAPTIDLKCSH